MGIMIAIAVFAGATFLATATQYWWWRQQHSLDPVLAGAWLKHDVDQTRQRHCLAMTLELDFSNPGYGTILVKRVTAKFQVETYLHFSQERRVRAAKGLIKPHESQSIAVPLSTVSLTGPPDQVPNLAEEDMHVSVEYASGRFERKVSWQVSKSDWDPGETMDADNVTRHFLIPYMQLLSRHRWYSKVLRLLRRIF